MAQLQDLTIFATDDDEEIIAPGYGGILDGEIVEATFSTDPEHPRPFLKRVFDVGESVIDFQKGSSVIGQVTIDVVDFPFEEDTQDQGFVTWLLATVNGDSAALGVRAVFRIQNAAGVMETIFDGVIDMVLQPKLTTFRFNIRDIRERERDMKLFQRATDTCIMPYVGPKEGWGHTHEYTLGAPNRYRTLTIQTIGQESSVFPRIRGLCGKMTRIYNGVEGSIWAFHFFNALLNQWHEEPKNLVVTPDYEELLNRFGAGQFSRPAANGRWLYNFSDIIVEWSYTGTVDTYSVVGPMERILVGNTPNSFAFSDQRVDGQDVRLLFAVYMSFTPAQIANGDEPDVGLSPTAYVRVVSNAPPTEDVPMFLEETLGETLRKAYDGDYSTPGTFIPVRYNEDAMLAIERGTPISLARVTEPVDDGRAWLQENIYRPAGYAPAIRSGKVYPLKYELPDAADELVQLDDSNSVSAGWQHGSSNVVNQVVFEYQREIVPTALHTGYVKPRVQRVIIDRNRLSEDSQRRHGTKPVTYKPVTLRSLVTESQVADRVPAQEQGALLSAARSEELLRRYTNGAQIVSAVCFRTEEIDALEEGAWVIGAWSWLANYVTRERGFNRLLQIVSIRRADPHLREFLLVDAGPYDVPMDQPTLDDMTENDDGSVTIAVSNVAADTKAQVQYALGETEPDANSGEWITVDYLTENGDASTPPNFWPGVLVWARVRGTADGRIASAWTAPESLRLSEKALIRDFTLAVNTAPESADYGKPIVAWDHMASTIGVRIAYLIHDRLSDMPLPAELTETFDVDAEDLTTTLDVVLRAWEKITMQLLGYTEFDGAAVGGALGGISATRTAQRIEGHYVKPSVGELLEREELLGILTLDILDPQLTITSLWFKTREGSSEEGWTAFVEDVAAPYGATVAIIPGQSSGIGYEVYALDHAGIEHLFKSGTVEFPFEGLPALFMRITLDTTDEDFAYYNIAVADPVPQAEDSITLFGTDGTFATITAPAGITSTGVPTGVPTDDLDTTDVVAVTIQRPNVGEGAELITFRAEAVGRSPIEMQVLVQPEDAPDEEGFVINIAEPSASAVGDVLTFLFDTTPPTGYDHFKIFCARTATPSYEDMEVTLADNDDTFDTNVWGWNLNPAGGEIRIIFFYIRVYDDENNIIGSSSLGQEGFEADADT